MALGDLLFDEASIATFGLELSAEATEALRVDPDDWVEAALVYRGVRFEPVAVHLKGNRGFLPIDEKPSFKIDLNRFAHGLELLGAKDLTLNAMATDASMMRERLAYRLFREHGLPASRASHVELTIDGEPRGLYTLVESVNDDLLALWFADPSGTMFEMSDVDFLRRDVGDFELESGADDRVPLEGISDALTLEPEEAGVAADPWLDWAAFTTFAAATAVSGQFDSYPWRTPGDDVHLYFDPTDGRGVFLPHGLDETFKRRNYDIFSGRGLLLASCLEVPSCREAYVAEVRAVQDTAERMDLLGHALAVQEQIRTAVEADPARPYTLEAVAEAQALVLDFVATRRDHLERQLGGR